MIPELDPVWRLQRCKEDIEWVLGMIPQLQQTIGFGEPLRKLDHAQGELSRAITLLRLMSER